MFPVPPVSWVCLPSECEPDSFGLHLNQNGISDRPSPVNSQFWKKEKPVSFMSRAQVMRMQRILIWTRELGVIKPHDILVLQLRCFPRINTRDRQALAFLFVHLQSKNGRLAFFCGGPRFPLQATGGFRRASSSVNPPGPGGSHLRWFPRMTPCTWCWPSFWSWRPPLPWFGPTCSRRRAFWRPKKNRGDMC